MKPMGRKHRAYCRIVAIDGRQPNDGRVIEELGSYDPHVADNDKNVTLNAGTREVLAQRRGQGLR